MVSVMNTLDDFVQSDAFPVSEDTHIILDYRKKLLRVSEQLVRRDIELLKYLCTDVIPASQLEEIRTGIRLFEVLETKGKLGPNKLQFLAECLQLIGRVDLLCRLDVSLAGLSRWISSHGEALSQFRKLLLRIAEDLERREVDSLIYQIVPLLNLSKMNASKIHTPLQLFIAMEQAMIISANDVRYLVSGLSGVGRPDLVENIHIYLEDGSRQRQSEAAGGADGLEPGKSDEEVGVPEDEAIFRNSRWVGGMEDDDLENLTVSTQEAKVGSLYPPPVLSITSGPNAGDSTGVEGMVKKFQTIGISKNDLQQNDHDLERYKMDANPRGYCLIINNSKFYQDKEDVESRVLKDREGSNIDADRLSEVFSSLGFLVEQKDNLTHTEMVKVCTEFAHKQHCNFDCFVCCVLTHGVKDHLYGTNGRLVAITELTSCFKALRCQELSGKPKLFFIQACQGKDNQEGAMEFEMDAPNDSRETIPNEADFLMGYATVPGFVSYRSKEQGSWYITELCSNLKNFGRKYDVMAILTNVNLKVSKARASMTSGTFKQVPAPMTTLRKQLYF